MRAQQSRIWNVLDEIVLRCNTLSNATIASEDLHPSWEGNGNPLQYSCLENPTDWEACRLYIVHGVAKSLLSNFTFTFTFYLLRASLIAQLVKNPPAMRKTPVLIPGSGRSTGEGLGYPLQYSWASLMDQQVKKPSQCWCPGFSLWIGKIPWSRDRLPTPVFWPGEFHGLYMEWDTTEPISLHFSLTKGLLSSLISSLLSSRLMVLFYFIFSGWWF